MGAFLVVQPRGLGRAGFDRGREWMERSSGLRPCGEADAVVQYERGTRKACSALAISGRGYLASAGFWDHPACSRPCDAGTLLAQLENEGSHALDALDGNYAIAWRDRDRLTVAPDHLARLHVYYAETSEGAFVSTSPIALARAASAEPDLLAVQEFLMSGTIYGDRTPFASVRRLQAGKRCVFEHGRLHHHEPAPTVPCPGSAGSAPALLDACGQAARRFLSLSGKPLSDLTGGVDSRLVLGLLLNTGLGFDVTVTGDDTSSDVRVAKRLAKRLGLPMLQEHESILCEARSSFESVLAAAVHTEGEYDAIEYAGIARLHEAHAASYDASVNGSGGEVYRNYWWDSAHLGPGRHDCISAAVPRFAGACQEVPFLKTPAPAAHFRAVIERALAGHEDDAAPDQLDRVYLHLRMQCWQGAIASATHRIWPNFSPLLLRGPLQALYALAPRRRLGLRLIQDLLRRLGHGLDRHALVSGFPAQSPNPLNAWRFLPGLALLPRRLWARRARQASSAAGLVQALMQSGGADFLRPSEMALEPLMDRHALDQFLERATNTGRVSVPLLGRLIALEFALRS